MPKGHQDVEYFHIELETHDVIFAEGTPVETFLVTDGREKFSNFVEYGRLYGREAGPEMVPYAPVLDYLRGRSHLEALLRLGISHVVDVRDPIQVAYDRIAARATAPCHAT
jgi:Hint domain